MQCICKFEGYFCVSQKMNKTSKKTNDKKKPTKTTNLFSKHLRSLRSKWEEDQNDTTEIIFNSQFQIKDLMYSQEPCELQVSEEIFLSHQYNKTQRL